MHQLPFIEAFAERFDGEVACVCGEAVTPDRIALGWADPSDTQVPLSTPSLAESLEDIAAAGRETLQVISGMHCHPYVNACFRKAVAARAPVALITESYDARGLRGLARHIRSRCDAIWYRDAVRLIFAMGAIGETWFRSVGFPANRVYPFSYVTAAPPVVPAQGAPHSGYRLLYVGQLIPRKGLDVLIRALAVIGSEECSLTIVGGGSAETELRALAAGLGVSDAVSWIGVLPHHAVAKAMGEHDVLVLPSRFDGWGAVVNEAIAVGTPVICSDACGASDLIRSPRMGNVVRAGSVPELAEAIQSRMGTAWGSREDRQHLCVAARRFSPTAVADYFYAAIRASFCGEPRPTPPWRVPC